MGDVLASHFTNEDSKPKRCQRFSRTEVRDYLIISVAQPGHRAGAPYVSGDEQVKVLSRVQSHV